MSDSVRAGGFPGGGPLAGIDWDDLRRKAWAAALVLAAAYAVAHPGWEWVVPVLASAAGMSKPPGSRAA